jgi:uncharacterized tellurite resistance protein B-like protein
MHSIPTDSSDTTHTAELRGALNRIDTVDAENDGYLSTLAFILQRVAAADEEICDEEVVRMEKILIDHAALSPTEALLTVEMAKQRSLIADCCCSYNASRHMRSLLDRNGRKQMRRFLKSVAEADGLIRHSEKAEIRQISTELGLH